MNFDAFGLNLSMLGDCSLCWCSGSGNLFALDGEVGVFDGVEVAGGAFDAEPEQVADSADVAAGGVNFVQDAVLAQRLGSQREA